MEDEMDKYEELTESIRLILLDCGFSEMANRAEMEDLAALIATSFIQGNQAEEILPTIVEYFGCPRKRSACGFLVKLSGRIKEVSYQDG